MLATLPWRNSVSPDLRKALTTATLRHGFSSHPQSAEVGGVVGRPEAETETVGVTGRLTVGATEARGAGGAEFAPASIRRWYRMALAARAACIAPLVQEATNQPS